MRAALGVVLGAFVFAQSAEAALQVTAQAVPSKTRTFRGLEARDDSFSANQVMVSTAGPTVTIADISAGIGTIPPDCQRTSTGIACPVADYDLIGLFTGPGNDWVDARGLIAPSLSQAQIASPDVAVYMNARLGPGADVYQPSAGTQAINGQAGRDELLGGRADDLLLGGTGADRIAGAGGKDILLGGSGSDRLSGGPGRHDLMIGGRNTDRCTGDRRDFVAGCEALKLR